MDVAAGNFSHCTAGDEVSLGRKINGKIYGGVFLGGERGALV
jgi:hypothetical protein